MTPEEFAKAAGLEEVEPVEMTGESRIKAAVLAGITTGVVTKLYYSDEESSNSSILALLNGGIASITAYAVTGNIKTTSQEGAIGLVAGGITLVAGTSIILGDALGRKLFG